MSKFIVTNHLQDPDGFPCALLEAAGLKPSYVKRLKLDFKVGDAAVMEVELYADDEVLRVDADGVQVVAVPEDEEAA